MNNKLTSGRFLATVFVIGTYCLSTILCIFLVMNDKLSIEAFLGIFTGFSGLAGMIIQGYFHKKEEIQ